jgi:hypothetical protein
MFFTSLAKRILGNFNPKEQSLDNKSLNIEEFFNKAPNLVYYFAEEI